MLTLIKLKHQQPDRTFAPSVSRSASAPLTFSASPERAGQSQGDPKHNPSDPSGPQIHDEATGRWKPGGCWRRETAVQPPRSGSKRGLLCSPDQREGEKEKKERARRRERARESKKIQRLKESVCEKLSFINNLRHTQIRRQYKWFYVSVRFEAVNNPVGTFWKFANTLNVE